MRHWRVVAALTLVAVAVFAGCGRVEQSTPITDMQQPNEDSTGAGAAPKAESADVADPEEFETRPTDYEKKCAIIIGIDSYSGGESRLPPLYHATNDARAVRSILIEEFGYNDEDVHYLTDQAATAREIRSALAEWLPPQARRKNDSALVFFAGHGEIDETTKEGYLAAVDSTKGDHESCISVRWLVKQLEALPCRHKLVILDSCYSGALFQPERPVSVAGRTLPRKDFGRSALRIRGDGGADRQTAGISYYLTHPAFFGMSAGRMTPVADGLGQDRHSLFTSALLRVMRLRAHSPRDDRMFTFRQLAGQVEGVVTSAQGSQQIPDWGYLGEGDGDFVFRPEVQRVMQVHFRSPEGMDIGWKNEDGDYCESRLIAPARYDFEQGWLYHLKVSEIAGRPGVEFYPSLKIGAPVRYDQHVANSTIEIKFTDEDFDRVLTGEPIVKVVIMPHPEYREIAIAGVEGSGFQTICSADLDPGIDPVLVAAPRGEILAIVHMGMRDYELGENAGDALDPVGGQVDEDLRRTRPGRFPMVLLDEAQRSELRGENLSEHALSVLDETDWLRENRKWADAVQLLKRLSETVETSADVGGELRNRLRLAIRFSLRKSLSGMGGRNYGTLQQAQRLLSEPTEAVFIEHPLEDVLDFYSDMHDIRMEVDRRELEYVGIAIDCPVTLVVEKGSCTLRSVFKRLYYDLDLVCCPIPRGFKVTTPEADELAPVRVNYPVADLASSPQGIDPRWLEKTIKRHIEPQTWSDEGGVGIIDYASESEMLVITQSWTVHLLIDEFLTDLRLAAPSIGP